MKWCYQALLLWDINISTQHQMICGVHNIVYCETSIKDYVHHIYPKTACGQAAVMEQAPNLHTD